MIASPARILTAVVAWPVRSQQTSRRNAMVAGTTLAARRRELVEVEEFLDRHARHGMEPPAAGEPA
ncbi:MAG TPA: hypothetical protein VFZ64_05880 [Nocardioidaceae bacterium]